MLLSGDDVDLVLRHFNLGHGRLLHLLAPTPLPIFFFGADDRLLDLVRKFASPFECVKEFYSRELAIVSKRKERKIYLLFI